MSPAAAAAGAGVGVGGLLPDAPCARCGGPFHCGAGDAGPCACSTLVLPPALLRDLRQRYTGCLCLDCLRALAASETMP